MDIKLTNGPFNFQTINFKIYLKLLLEQSEFTKKIKDQIRDPNVYISPSPAVGVQIEKARNQKKIAVSRSLSCILFSVLN